MIGYVEWTSQETEEVERVNVTRGVTNNGLYHLGSQTRSFGQRAKSHSTGAHRSSERRYIKFSSHHPIRFRSRTKRLNLAVENMGGIWGINRSARRTIVNGPHSFHSTHPVEKQAELFYRCQTIKFETCTSHQNSRKAHQLRLMGFLHWLLSSTANGPAAGRQRRAPSRFIHGHGHRLDYRNHAAIQALAGAGAAECRYPADQDRGRTRCPRRGRVGQAGGGREHPELGGGGRGHDGVRDRIT